MVFLKMGVLKRKRLVRTEIKKAKFKYKEKTEDTFKSNDLKSVWKGMSVMTRPTRAWP